MTTDALVIRRLPAPGEARLATINLTESRLACRRDQYRLARMFLAVAGRAPGDDLDDPGAEADQHAQLPGAVIGAEYIEDQPAAPRAERRSDLVHDESDAE